MRHGLLKVTCQIKGTLCFVPGEDSVEHTRLVWNKTKSERFLRRRCVRSLTHRGIAWTSLDRFLLAWPWLICRHHITCSKWYQKGLCVVVLKCCRTSGGFWDLMMFSLDLILWNSTSFTFDAITVAADPISFSAAAEPVSKVITSTRKRDCPNRNKRLAPGDR